MALSWLKKKFQAFELYTVDVVLGRRADTGAAVYGAFLQVLSWIWSLAVQARLWLYRNRILRDQPLGCLVVVVGNLTVGGTGKTPVVEKFARALRDRGRKVAILSRGYKSRARPSGKSGGSGSPTPRSRPRASSATETGCCSTARTPATNPTCLPGTSRAWLSSWTRTG